MIVEDPCMVFSYLTNGTKFGISVSGNWCLKELLQQLKSDRPRSYMFISISILTISVLLGFPNVKPLPFCWKDRTPTIAA
jgi:hypothetical protein